MVLLEGKDGFELGQMLGGKYKLLSTLGTGGMGTVYKVLQVFLNKQYALKTMNIHAVSTVSVQRFQLEAKAASSLNHPNLVHVHDFGLLEDDQPYLVMDLVNGITFAEYLKEQGPLSVDNVTDFFAPACFGLLAVHEKGLVHRDIKPGNLMVEVGLTPEAGPSIKVVDFGIAKRTTEENGEIQALTATGEIFGSPLYMSPEQCTGGVVDHRSDIYSLGCVLFEMLTGTPPYFGHSALATMMLHESGKPPTLKEASLGNQFPAALEQVVAKMLRKSPSERYQNIGLVAHDLAIACRGGEVAAPRSSKRAIKESNGPSTNIETVTFATKKLYTLFALTALIPAALAWISGYYFKQNQVPILAPAELHRVDGKMPGATDGGATVATNSKQSDPYAADKQLVEASGPIQATLVDHDGGQQRMYVFPKPGIGMLCSYNHLIPTDGREICPAKGTVYLPPDGDLLLKLNTADSLPALLAPSVFRKINGKEFRGLFLSNSTLENFNDELNYHLKESPTETIVTVLKNLFEWPGLESITLKDCTLSPAAFTALSQLKLLRNLTLEDCTFDPAELVKHEFLLPRLEYLSLTGLVTGGDQVIKSLAHSDQLVTLRLVARGGSTSAAAFRELRLCPSLRTIELRFKNAKVEDSFIAAVCQLKQVHEVRLQECKLSTSQIEMLHKSRGFAKIYFSQKDYQSSESREQIKKIDPRIAFI